LKSGSRNHPTWFFFENVLGVLGLFEVPYDFSDQLVNFCKEANECSEGLCYPVWGMLHFNERFPVCELDVSFL
jgi:hypothetical protein